MLRLVDVEGALKLLRRDLGLDRGETEKTMVERVLGILEGKSR